MQKELATNFNQKMLAKINDVLRFSLENDSSDFYLKKYAGAVALPITSHEEFQKIPLLSKNEILQIETTARSFVPNSEIVSYSFSSGTMGQPVPSIIPHSSYYHEEMGRYLYDRKILSESGVKKILLLIQPNAALFTRSLLLPNPPVTFIPGDIHNLKIMAKIFEELKIEGMMTNPTILDFLIEELRVDNFDFSQIKWISLGSEFCSTLRYNYFRGLFPCAFFHLRYGNAEIGGSRHYRCEHLIASGKPNVFHIDMETELTEILDKQGKPVPNGQTGEIVHTDLKPKAFPLIRYRLKDMGSLDKTHCKCGNDYTLIIDGRADFDVLKLHGTTIYAELISQAVGQVQEFVEPRFQLHVHEELSGEKPKVRLKIHLKLRPAHAGAKNDIFLIETLKEKISAHLQLSGKMTLKDMIDQGSYLPLEIVFVSKWEQDTLKTKNIISHLE